MYNKMNKFIITGSAFLLSVVVTGFAQETSPKDIVEKAYYNERSEAYSLNMTIEVIRPTWSRELTTKTWAKGSDYGMMVITAPAKDQGVSFMRINSEGWNYIPSIDRIVKISPSQMSQSWMGSDYTNEDLLKEASIIKDYEHKLLGTDIIEGIECYKIEATPKPDAAVIWGRKILWIGKGDLLERKVENYDETGTLISTLIKSEVKSIGGKTIATKLTMTPATKSGQKTVVTIHSGSFSETMDQFFFTKENMKQVR